MDNNIKQCNDFKNLNSLEPRNFLNMKNKKNDTELEKRIS